MQPPYCQLTWAPETQLLEVMDKVFSSQPDLSNQPISHVDIKYFTDSNNFVQDGMSFTRNGMVTLDSVFKARLLQAG
jgi:hypothetical protein